MDAFLGLDPSNKEKLKRSQDHKKQKEVNDKKQIKLWIEKYRPKSLDEIVFQDNVVKALKRTKETGKMQHLLFYGPPGTGKTSAILAVSNKYFESKINMFILSYFLTIVSKRIIWRGIQKKSFGIKCIG